MKQCRLVFVQMSRGKRRSCLSWSFIILSWLISVSSRRDTTCRCHMQRSHSSCFRHLVSRQRFGATSSSDSHVCLFFSLSVYANSITFLAWFVFFYCFWRNVRFSWCPFCWFYSFWIQSWICISFFNIQKPQPSTFTWECLQPNKHYRVIRLKTSNERFHTNLYYKSWKNGNSFLPKLNQTLLLTGPTY